MQDYVLALLPLVPSVILQCFIQESYLNFSVILAVVGFLATSHIIHHTKGIFAKRGFKGR